VSARVEERPGTQASLAIAIAAAGFALLLARPSIPLASSGRPFLLVLIYATVTAASIATVEPRGERVVPPVATLTIGVAALLLAGPVAGAAPAAATTSWTLPLGLAAAVAEEAFFRRFLYGRLLAAGAPVAVVVSAFAFAAIHVPEYGVAAFWVDLGAGLLLSWQRWASGTWTVPAATHAIANVLAVM
jgi:membrane protease YdiL (CAAX protease family)